MRRVSGWGGCGGGIAGRVERRTRRLPAPPRGPGTYLAVSLWGRSLERNPHGYQGRSPCRRRLRCSDPVPAGVHRLHPNGFHRTGRRRRARTARTHRAARRSGAGHRVGRGDPAQRGPQHRARDRPGPGARRRLRGLHRHQGVRVGIAGGHLGRRRDRTRRIRHHDRRRQRLHQQRRSETAAEDRARGRPDRPGQAQAQGLRLGAAPTRPLHRHPAHPAQDRRAHHRRGDGRIGREDGAHPRHLPRRPGRLRRALAPARRRRDRIRPLRRRGAAGAHPRGRGDRPRRTRPRGRWATSRWPPSGPGATSRSTPPTRCSSDPRSPCRARWTRQG